MSEWTPTEDHKLILARVAGHHDYQEGAGMSSSEWNPHVSLDQMSQVEAGLDKGQRFHYILTLLDKMPMDWDSQDLIYWWMASAPAAKRCRSAVEILTGEKFDD